MKITYIGQAGLLFESENTSLMIDPYLSDSVEKLNNNCYRRVAVDERFLRYKPDILLLTHNHLDHYDPETAHRILENGTATVLAPRSVWQEIRKRGGQHNYVEFIPHTEWTQGDLHLIAVRACHSDPDAIGVIIEDGKKRYYVTGDTLYSTDVLAGLPSGIDVIFLPVNGDGNNMNKTDAARFAEKSGAEIAVPLHVGLLDDQSADDFPFANKVIPTIYQEVTL